MGPLSTERFGRGIDNTSQVEIASGKTRYIRAIRDIQITSEIAQKGYN